MKHMSENRFDVLIDSFMQPALKNVVIEETESCIVASIILINCKIDNLEITLGEAGVDIEINLEEKIVSITRDEFEILEIFDRSRDIEISDMDHEFDRLSEVAIEHFNAEKDLLKSELERLIK